MADAVKSGNIGEHSELLALARIVVDGFLELGVPGDGGSEQVGPTIPVFGVSRTPPVGTKLPGRGKKMVDDEVQSRGVYCTSGDDVVLVSEPDGATRRVCSKSELHEAALRLREQLIYWSSPQFKAEKKEQRKAEQEGGANSRPKSLQSVHSQRILDLLGLKALRAKSGAKSDLYLTVESSGRRISQGYSVKSHMGSKSCLVNHSGATIFKYEILNSSLDNACVLEDRYIYAKAASLGEPEKATKMKRGPSTVIPALLREPGVSIKFDSVVSSTFRDNLEMIDGRFPEALAMVILQRFKTGKSKLVDLASDEELHKRLVAAGMSSHNAAKYLSEKLKDMLRKFAMGMQASSEWSDSAEVKGGWVLVIRSGKVVGYRFDSTDDFRAYLLEHTMIDTPSTKRIPKKSQNGRVGRVFEREGRVFITLSLIVKFTE